MPRLHWILLALLAVQSPETSFGRPAHPVLSQLLADAIQSTADAPWQQQRRGLQEDGQDTHTITSAHPVTSSVSRYVVGQDRWEAVRPMAVERSDHTATWLNGKLYVAGGCAADQVASCAALTSVFEEFDPLRNEWRALPPLPRQRYRHAAAAVGSKLYLVGGVDVAPVAPSSVYYDNPVSCPPLQFWPGSAPVHCLTQIRGAGDGDRRLRLRDGRVVDGTGAALRPH